MPSGRPSGDPPQSARSARVEEVVAVARTILERDGPAGLTMRGVADEMRIKAPSLYKHVTGKAAIEVELVRLTLTEMGRALHAALGESAHEPTAGSGPVRALLDAYRRYALAHPDLYRLATAGRLPREQLPAGLEDWAGEPFLTVTGDEHRAQALWSFAHGMVILELDDRFPAGGALDRTWAEGAAAFGGEPTAAGSGSPGQDRR